MEQKLYQAKYTEWLGSLLGACGVALGLGVIFSEYLQSVASYLIIAGLFLHSWGMYKTHVRNK